MDPIVILALVAVFFILIISNIHIVTQAHAFVVERLGAFHTVWATGLHFKIPFIKSEAKRS